MMVVSLHDRISGHANRVRVLDRFLAYARSRPDVWFARKDEIANGRFRIGGRRPSFVATRLRSADYQVRRADQLLSLTCRSVQACPTGPVGMPGIWPPEASSCWR